MVVESDRPRSAAEDILVGGRGGPLPNIGGGLQEANCGGGGGGQGGGGGSGAEDISSRILPPENYITSI
jgi:hypothetical protein